MDRSLSVVGALAVWRSRARVRARAVVSMSSPARVAATTIEDVDAATLGKVLERLDDPADVVAFAASNRHLAAAADEPAWRAKFAASWDDPTFPVASYRELLLARHRALGAVSLGSALSPDATTPAPDFATLAAACDELARAVHASARVERTDATLRAACVLASLAAWLETLRRSPPSPSAAPTARRAVVSASRLVGAVAARCDGCVADALEDRRGDVARRLLAACFAVPRRRPPDRASPVRLGWWDWCAGGATAPPDWEAARGGFEREDDPRPPAPAVDALAAAMGAAPPPPRARDIPLAPPKIDHALALIAGPLAMRAEAHAAASDLDVDRPGPAEGRRERSFSVVASAPAIGPWPRGGRPPLGRRSRFAARSSAPPPPTTASMSGAWFGRRMTVTTRFPAAATGSRRTLDPPAVDVSLDTAFRLALTATPEGALGGWMKDTVGDATLRGRAGPLFFPKEEGPDGTRRVAGVIGGGGARGGGGDASGCDASEEEVGAAVALDARFERCGGMPGAALASHAHGAARIHLRGFANASFVAGEWTQWSGGGGTRGVFVMWPCDEAAGKGPGGGADAGKGEREAGASRDDETTRF